MNKIMENGKTTRNIILGIMALIAFLNYDSIISIFKPNESDKAIEIVKQSNANSESYTWGEFLTKAAGLEGRTDWTSFVLNNNNSTIRIVEANIIKTHKGLIDTLRIQWKVNTETKFCKSCYFEINGKPESMISGMMDLELWTIN